MKDLLKQIHIIVDTLRTATSAQIEQLIDRENEQILQIDKFNEIDKKITDLESNISGYNSPFYILESIYFSSQNFQKRFIRHLEINTTSMMLNWVQIERVINDINDAAGEKAARTLKELGCNAIYIRADVSKNTDVKRMFEFIAERFGKLDILVNNAGISLIKPLTELDESEWDKVINVNLKSVFLCSKHAIPLMRNGGVIINISSVLGLVGSRGESAYCASKGGVIAMTKSFAQEAATSGIRYNSITPGFISTEMTDALSDDIKDNFTSKIPMKRFGNANEVAEAVAFLLSDHASYITGETLKVNGGMNMA